jgi:hypothetical protein
MQFRMSVCALAALVSLCGRGASASDAPGAVYALTNDPAGNAVLVYDRAADGSLTAAGAYATGGAGSAAGLGSQGAVIVSDDRRWLFAANTGSNSISSFRIHPQDSSWSIPNHRAERCPRASPSARDCCTC